jgi:hypothetical protein
LDGENILQGGGASSTARNREKGEILNLKRV